MKTAALLLAGLVLAPIGAVAAPCADLAADVAAMQRCSDRKLEAAGASLEQLSADVDRLRARRDAGAKKIALSEFRQDYFNGRPTAVLGFHIDNGNGFAVRDLVVTCAQIGASGTTIRTASQTVFQRIEPHAGATVDRLAFGFWDMQAQTIRCQVTGFNGL